MALRSWRSSLLRQLKVEISQLMAEAGQARVLSEHKTVVAPQLLGRQRFIASATLQYAVDVDA